MKEITRKIHDKHMDSFKPMIEELAAEGATEDQIVRAYQAHLKSKANNYYTSTKNKMWLLGDAIRLDELKQTADSKAEHVFCEMLTDAQIPFKFQYGIGPYTADYLIAGFIVFEIDGPHHLSRKKEDASRDKYMRGMGYRVIRVPLNILCACPEAVIDEIKEAVKIKRIK